MGDQETAGNLHPSDYSETIQALVRKRTRDCDPLQLINLLTDTSKES